ncbi:hypothetical protein ScoT_34680 [Streptomyces albidoflavus]|uniref:Integrase n=1 Tax=Streptomyces albidoflavus TaxID=1886 RepID=A0AA37C297_9ACTN|nr:hypothetical protein ScoT_34680 [Streptomyces albidoflavus]
MPFRRSTFGRKWRKARVTVGLPENFRFYDLRHTGHTLTTRSGATLKDTMVRAGQSNERAALIYQHSDTDRQRGGRRPRQARTGTAHGSGIAGIWHATPRQVHTTNKARVDDLGLCRGAGDENRTRALSLGITRPLSISMSPDLRIRVQPAKWVASFPACC